MTGSIGEEAALQTWPTSSLASGKQRDAVLEQSPARAGGEPGSRLSAKGQREKGPFSAENRRAAGNKREAGASATSARQQRGGTEGGGSCRTRRAPGPSPGDPLGSQRSLRAFTSISLYDKTKEANGVFLYLNTGSDG